MLIFNFYLRGKNKIELINFFYILPKKKKKKKQLKKEKKNIGYFSKNAKLRNSQIIRIIEKSEK